MQLTSAIDHNLSTYSNVDYRRFISAHLQFLADFCQLARQAADTAKEEFLSSSLISAELLPEGNFYDRLQSAINRSQSSAPKTFQQLLFLIQNLNHGNSFVSNYETNFRYMPSPKPFYSETAYTQDYVYDDQCSCALYKNCSTQAHLIIAGAVKPIPIAGLKTGCTSSETILRSTLECFYNQSCIDLLRRYTDANTSSIFHPLSAEKTRFPTNATVATLLDSLFVEDWTREVDYARYFNNCAPSICTRTYVHRYTFWRSIGIMLGLQGGLKIILRWICPKVVYAVYAIHRYRKRRANVIQPVHTIVTTSVVEIGSRTSNQRLAKIIVACVLFMTVLTLLTFFSLRLARPKSAHQAVQASNSEGTTHKTSLKTTIRSPTTLITVFATTFREFINAYSRRNLHLSLR